MNPKMFDRLFPIPRSTPSESLEKKVDRIVNETLEAAGVENCSPEDRKAIRAEVLEKIRRENKSPNFVQESAKGMQTKKDKEAEPSKRGLALAEVLSASLAGEKPSPESLQALRQQSVGEVVAKVMKEQGDAIFERVKAKLLG